MVQYAIFYAISAEYDTYGNLQNYLVDSDPVIPISTAVSSYYTDEPNPPPPNDPKGNLRIVKLQSGTEIPLSGAIFEVLTPDGDTLGSFVTNTNGLIELDAPMIGNYTITELVPPLLHFRIMFSVISGRPSLFSVSISGFFSSTIRCNFQNLLAFSFFLWYYRDINEEVIKECIQ